MSQPAPAPTDRRRHLSVQLTIAVVGALMAVIAHFALPKSPGQSFFQSVSHLQGNGWQFAWIHFVVSYYTQVAVFLAQGVLVSVDYPTHPHSQPPGFSRIEYSDFISLESHAFPGRIKALSGRKTVAAFTVVKLAKIENLNSALFGDLPGAQFWRTCENDLQKGKLLNHVQPEYPPDARANHVQGTVAFFAVIEVDGSLSQITLIHPAAPELEKAAFQAISQWRYQPSTCAGFPIRVETMISTDFSLDL